MCTYLSADKAIPFLCGRTGVGKSATILEAARRRGKRLIRINMSSTLTSEELLAKTSIKINPATERREITFELQPFTLAFRDGHWVLLDEMNLREEIQSIERALDTDELVLRDVSSASEPIKIIRRHPEFRLFATQNPAAGLFKGRRESHSLSFLSRFSMVVFNDLPSEEWVEVVASRLMRCAEGVGQNMLRSIANRMVDFHVEIQKLVHSKEFPERGSYAIITIRELLIWAERVTMFFKPNSQVSASAFDLSELQACMGNNALLVYGCRFRGAGCARIEKILENFQWPHISSLSKKIDWNLACTENGSRVLSVNDLKLPLSHSENAFSLITPDSWEINLPTVPLPANSEILQKCEAVHREIADLLLSKDFIEAHGLYRGFSISWMWQWIKEGSAGSLLDTASVSSDVETQFGLLGASLYVARIRHDSARHEIVHIFQQHFNFDGQPQVAPGIVPAIPYAFTPNCVKVLALAFLAKNSGSPVMIEGKSGCGKAACVSVLAYLDCAQWEEVPLTTESECGELIGEYRPTGSGKASSDSSIQWHDGPIPRAFTSGHIAVLKNSGQAQAVVLERLNPILEKPPTVWLTEKGDAEPLKRANSGYALFATFTPPGRNAHGYDMQSAELTPALANRFSIIHMDDVCDGDEEKFKEEIKHMAKVLLNDNQDGVARLASALCWELHQILVQNRSKLASLTLRTYINFLDCTYSLQRNYPEQLGALEAALKCAYLITFHAQIRCIKLQKILLKTVDKLTSKDPTDCFEMPSFLQEVVTPADLVLTDNRKKHAEMVLACVACGKPVLLEGPPAVGKTALICGLNEALGGSTGRVARLNNSDTTTLQDYFGTWLPSGGDFVFCKGNLVRAMESGCWFLADELNLAPLPVIAAVVQVLGQVIEGKQRIQIPGTSISVQTHPGFRFFATQNDHKTPGRNLLPINIRNRFLELQVEEFEHKELEEVIFRRFRATEEGQCITREVKVVVSQTLWL